METKNLTIEYSVAFKSNRGNFDKQPIITMINNPGLTGDDFISLYRIRRSKAPSQSLTGSLIAGGVTGAYRTGGDGVLGLTIGSSAGLTSLSGSTRIQARSLTAAHTGLTADWASNNTLSGNLWSTTSTNWLPTYDITINQIGRDNYQVITLEKDPVGFGDNIYTSDISVTGIPDLADMNVLGNGIRPLGKQQNYLGTTPTGEKGKGEILTYLYNRMEVVGDRTSDGGQDPALNGWHSNGLTAVFDRSFNSLSGDLQGKAKGKGVMQTAGVCAAGTATVTGWSMGPIEGAFRLDGGGYIKTNRLSASASLFNTRDINTSGMTFMTYVRFHATGANQNIITIAGDETNPAFELSCSHGQFTFNNYISSITAGSLTSPQSGSSSGVVNTMGATITADLGRWYHLTGVVSATGSNSGMAIYVDGEKHALACQTVSISAGDPTTSTSGREVAMAQLTNPYALLGSDKAGNGALVPHDLALTRIFNRALSDSEVFQNFIATVPGNIVLNSIKIG